MKDFSPLALTSAVVGFPVRIGIITRMDGTVIRFSESDEAVTVDGDTYTPVPGLVVSAVKHTSNGEVPSCQLIAVYGSGLIFDGDEIDTGLLDGAKVQIYYVDRMNPSRKGLLFTGAISDTTYDPVGHLATFEVKGPSASAKILMTRKRAPMCQTDLFSTLCGVNKTTYAVSASVASIVDAFNFTVSGSLAQTDGYFNQGVAVTANGGAFEISNWMQPTQTITTYLPCNRLVTEGLGLTLYPGCDKTLGPGGCAKFFNHLNFQGEPHFLGTAASVQQV